LLFLVQVNVLQAGYLTVTKLMCIRVLLGYPKPENTWWQGVVTRMVDKFVAEIDMVESGDVVRVDQAELETVIPSPGEHEHLAFHKLTHTLPQG
jgi:hypothetical protein